MPCFCFTELFSKEGSEKQEQVRGTKEEKSWIPCGICLSLLGELYQTLSTQQAPPFFFRVLHFIWKTFLFPVGCPIKGLRLVLRVLIDILWGPVLDNDCQKAIGRIHVFGWRARGPWKIENPFYSISCFLCTLCQAKRWFWNCGSP